MMTITIIMAETGLYDLLTWTSPSFPIGAFAYSGGLEWAVEAGHVADRATAEAWIAALLGEGPIWNDAVLFVHAHRAATRNDAPRLAAIAELAAASLTSAERRLEATAQGAAFRRIAADTAPGATLALLDPIDDADLPYAIAAACHFAGHGIALAPALTAWLHGTIANLVSAAQRLVPLGQTDGQRILRSLREALLATVRRAESLPDDDDPFAAMGGCCLVADIGGMAHETQYTRLFRT